MADPLLTTLCAICHAQPPKYTCPACHTHTCSLPCTQRHKAWSACTGRRDPTAFRPLHALKTPAGIDHDYNFLTAIERDRERTQRALLDGSRGGGGGGGGSKKQPALFTEAQLGRDLDGERRWRREWFGEEVRFVRSSNSKNGGGGGSGGNGNTAAGEDGEDGDERQAEASLARRVRLRLEAVGTEIVRMPVGMVRQRENSTAWNRRAGRINWCVEWIIYDSLSPSSSASASASANRNTQQQQQRQQKQRQQQQPPAPPSPLRLRHKALETCSLYRALGDSLAWYHRGKQRNNRSQPYGAAASSDDDDDDENENDDAITATYPRLARKYRRVLIKEVHNNDDDDGGGDCDNDARHRSAPQDPATGTFSHRTPYPTQNPYTGAWDAAADAAATVTSWLADEAVARLRGCRFYLLRPLTPANAPRELIPCDADDTLAAALRGRTVLEFPTVYVLPPPVAPAAAAANDDDNDDAPTASPTPVSAPAAAPDQTGEQLLPPGFVLGATARRAPPPKRKPAKRKAAKATAAGPNGRLAPNKRQRRGGGSITGVNSAGRGRGGAQSTMVHRRRLRGDMEEGEIASGGEGGEGGGNDLLADTTSSAPETSSSDGEGEEDKETEKNKETEHVVKDVARAAYSVGVGPGTGLAGWPSPKSSPKSSSLPHTTARARPTGFGGLVSYGSSSDDDDDDDDDQEEDEEGEVTTADLASLQPEDPELVAGAIQEIVGLLT